MVFRAIAEVKANFSLKSRNGNEFNYNFPEIAELKQLANNTIIDGELSISIHSDSIRQNQANTP
jgi:ATP-dependent DNA ligase